MDLNTYQQLAKKTAIYPKHPDCLRLIYPVLGLVGESGEVANKVKKLIRDLHLYEYESFNEFIYDNPKAIKQIIEEIGDCLWYIAAIAIDLNIDLSDIAYSNIEKLQKRKDKDKIKGNGDNR